MRKLFLLLTTAMLTFGFAASAGASAMNWSGTSTLVLGAFPPVDITGGGVVTVNGSAAVSAGDHLNTMRFKNSRGQISGNFTQPVTDPTTEGNSIVSIQFIDIEGGTGTIAPISGAVQSTTNLTQNVLPVKGLVKLCLFDTACASFIPIILNQATTPTGTQTKGVGIGGLLTVKGGNGIRLSLLAAPWTVKTRTVVDQIETAGGDTSLVNVTFQGFAHGPNSSTSSTISPSGVVQLVTPSQVRTNLSLGTSDYVGSATLTKYHFVPEPGLLLLLGSGVVGLAVLGRKRMRK